uniref:CSON013746 protein n=1 Tax=Culicoides sonorensis TaxID=179676 RepID=A0A336KZD3_CULSO
MYVTDIVLILKQQTRMTLIKMRNITHLRFIALTQFTRFTANCQPKFQFLIFLDIRQPSTRPESDFTLDTPKAEELRAKMEKQKQFRNRCRLITYFLGLLIFLLTVMIVSLVLTRGKRMFGKI